MDREEAKTAMSKLIDVFRKEYPNGGAFAAIHATGGHNLINKIYDVHEAELKTKNERIAELEAMVQKMKCCENCSFYLPRTRCSFDTQYSCLDEKTLSNWKGKNDE